MMGTTVRRPGRPAKTTYGTVAARVKASDCSIAWSDGQWAGHPVLIAAARALVRDGETPGVEELLLPWGGGTTFPTDQNVLGALAIMVDDTVCGADAALSGDVPEGFLKALVELGLEDPETDVAGFMSGRGF